MDEKEFIKMLCSCFIGIYTNQIQIMHLICVENGADEDTSKCMQKTFEKIEKLLTVIKGLDKKKIFTFGGN
jgi:uncharacterized protein YktB (UPF0637 family)